VKCIEKKDKYSARERTGPNVVKLEHVRVFSTHCMLCYAGPGADFLEHLGLLSTVWLATLFARIIIEQLIPGDKLKFKISRVIC